MYMVMFVLDDPNQLDVVLDAWAAIGVSGVTFVESAGLHRRRAQQAKVHLRYCFVRPTGPQQQSHYTLFAIVETEESVRACLAATEGVVGDLSRPNTGIFAAWPLSVVRGVPKNPAAGEAC